MKQPRFRVLGLLAGSALVWQSFAIQVLGQWSHDPNVNTGICTAANEQFSSTSVTDGSGGAIVAWADYRAGTDTAYVYAQRIGATGIVRWTVDGIPLFSNLAPFTMASDGAGGAVFAWENYRSNGSIPDLYVQRIDSVGASRWTPGGVCVSTGAMFPMAHHPAIVSDQTGGAIIAWRDVRNSGSSYYDIYAQRVSAAGAVLWTANGVAICSATRYQGDPVIVTDGANGAIIAWEDVRSGTNYDIYGQLVNASGLIQWTFDGVPISIATNDQRSPITAVSDGNGGAIFAWNDLRAGTNTDIYGQRINRFGIAQWNANGVAVSTAANDQVIPTIVSDGAAGAIIAWSDGRSGTGYDSYAQRINSAGIPLWTPDGKAVKNAASSPKMIPDGSGGAVITWSALGDVFAQRITRLGVAMWDTSGVAISTAANGQGNPTIVSDGAGGAIITWDDMRSGTDGDIYAQHLNSDGTLGGVTSAEDAPAHRFEFKLGQNYPNPFNPSTTITYELPTASHVTLIVYNVLGQDVAVVVNEDKQSGVHQARFDALNFPGGVYFYRIQTKDFVETKKLLVLR
jgi:hypothetical protein